MLESDGIKLFDLAHMAGIDDLRQSLGPLQRQSLAAARTGSGDQNESLILLQELEGIKKERDHLKQRNEKMVRDHLNQTLGKSTRTSCVELFYNALRCSSGN